MTRAERSGGSSGACSRRERRPVPHLPVGEAGCRGSAGAHRQRLVEISSAGARQPRRWRGCGPGARGRRRPRRPPTGSRPGVPSAHLATVGLTRLHCGSACLPRLAGPCGRPGQEPLQARVTGARAARAALSSRRATRAEGPARRGLITPGSRLAETHPRSAAQPRGSERRRGAARTTAGPGSRATLARAVPVVHPRPGGTAKAPPAPRPSRRRRARRQPLGRASTPDRRTAPLPGPPGEPQRPSGRPATRRSAPGGANPRHARIHHHQRRPPPSPKCSRSAIAPNAKRHDRPRQLRAVVVAVTSVDPRRRFQSVVPYFRRPIGEWRTLSPLRGDALGLQHLQRGGSHRQHSGEGVSGDRVGAPRRRLQRPVHGAGAADPQVGAPHRQRARGRRGGRRTPAPGTSFVFVRRASASLDWDLIVGPHELGTGTTASLLVIHSRCRRPPQAKDSTNKPLLVDMNNDGQVMRVNGIRVKVSDRLPVDDRRAAEVRRCSLQGRDHRGSAGPPS